MAEHRRKRPQRSGTRPGSPGEPGNPDAEQVAAEYLHGPPAGEPPAELQNATDGDPDDMASGTLRDQQVYEGLAENGGAMPPAADPRARRQRSPLAERTAPGRRAPASRGRLAKTAARRRR